jgi:ABC-type uncharacterized transport system involved in gliding motility auxiliary subunit
MVGFTGIVALLAILVAGNFVLKGTRSARLDLTNGKLYTLTDGTKQIVRKLNNDVTLLFFFSSSYTEAPPYVKDFAKQVEDLLKEYSAVSGGRIKVQKYDPAPDSEAEEMAQKYGVAGQPLEMFGPPVYFGLVARCGNEEAVLPSLDPRAEQLLEYGVTRLIYRVTHPEKPVVGVMGGLPVMGMQMPPMGMPGQRPRSQPPWIVFQELMQDYTLKDLPPAMTEEIPPEVKLLIVVHPKMLSDKALYAIDQFVLRGGRLLAFMDPLCIIDSENSQMAMFGGGQKSASTLGKLLTTWGVQYDPEKVVMDLKSATRVQSENGVEDTPVWLSIGTNGLNRSDILTVQLEAMMLPQCGSLSATGAKDMSVTPLITSSDTACLVSSMSAQMGGQMLRSSFKSAGMPYNIAIKMKGKFKTAFPDGKPKDEKDQGTNAVDIASAQVKGLTEGESTVVLVADVDMLFDAFCMDTMDFLGSKTFQPKNHNSMFFLNAVEQLTGSTDLMTVRSRTRTFRPYDKVVEMHKKAMVRWQEEESRLEDELKKVQARLQELQTSKDKNQRVFLNANQKKAVSEFRDKELAIKKNLKNVRKELRRDIENLGVEVKVINIAGMPLLVCLAGIIYAIYRRHKR